MFVTMAPSIDEGTLLAERNILSTTSNASNISTTSTLHVSSDVSLTLGTDSLIILDEEIIDRSPGNCCGLVLNDSRATRAIPFYNILWAELVKSDLTIHYAQRISATSVRPAYHNYAIDVQDTAQAEQWLAVLLDRAYGAAKPRKRIKVLVNPFGGQGKAQKLFAREIEPVLAAARCDVDVERTAYGGHAADIAEALNPAAWDVVACCSGDGVPHEVFNGLGRKPDAARALRDVAVVQLPCGSGNALSLNMNGTASPSLATLAVVKGVRTPLDLVSVTQGADRTLSFLSQSFGMVADCDVGTEHMRWMGSARFTVGFLTRILGKCVYPCDIAIGVEHADKDAVRRAYWDTARRKHLDHLPEEDEESYIESDLGLPPLRFGTVNDPLPDDWRTESHDHLGTFYCGNMAYMAPDANFFPAALPSEGLGDLITIPGNISRTAALSTLLSVENGTFFDVPHVNYRKVTGYRITPRACEKGEDGHISVDGEKFPFEPFQAEVHKGLGTTLSRTGRVYEASGPGDSIG
ncbi:sphingosine kinase [Lineolata rhizophorae]|uniref:Sphingosine kinase n=1 Tax=Lineolata rhizophorae TaxID=578093 RepID=A0A6A6PCE8_9PEZI|nr:sphingosine kinase [Lineolata rhizophorae]